MILRRRAPRRATATPNPVRELHCTRCEIGWPSNLGRRCPDCHQPGTPGSVLMLLEGTHR